MELKDLRIVFMGTPSFAVCALKNLIEANFSVVGIVTSPDKPSGRGQHTHESAVKQFSHSYPSIPLLQPLKLKDPEFIEQLLALKPNLFIVVAFRMLPEIVWKMPALGTINLHASILPDYRGAAPINWAIINGENKTGVTTFFIEKEIDTGKIIDTQTVDILPDESAGELHDILMNTGANLLVKSVLSIAEGTYQVKDQRKLIQSSEIKIAPKIFKEDCRIKWDDSLNNIFNLIRGLSPSPGAWTTFFKLDGTNKFTAKILSVEKEFVKHNLPIGQIFTDTKRFLKVSVKGGYLHIKEIQAEGKKLMDIESFLRGFNQIMNYYLG